jgi:hypothetical protein
VIFVVSFLSFQISATLVIVISGTSASLVVFLIVHVLISETAIVPKSLIVAATTSRDSVLSVKSPNYTTAIITASEPSADTNAGTNIKIGGNANTVIGSGESPTSCMNDLLTSTSEGMYITSDGSITFYVNAQTYANKKTFAFLSDGKIQTPTGTIWIA